MPGLSNTVFLLLQLVQLGRLFHRPDPTLPPLWWAHSRYPGPVHLESGPPTLPWLSAGLQRARWRLQYLDDQTHSSDCVWKMGLYHADSLNPQTQGKGKLSLRFFGADYRTLKVFVWQECRAIGTDCSRWSFTRLKLKHLME